MGGAKSKNFIQRVGGSNKNTEGNEEVKSKDADKEYIDQNSLTETRTFILHSGRKLEGR